MSHTSLPAVTQLIRPHQRPCQMTQRSWSRCRNPAGVLRQIQQQVHPYQRLWRLAQRSRALRRIPGGPAHTTPWSFLPRQPAGSRVSHRIPERARRCSRQAWEQPPPLRHLREARLWTAAITAQGLIAHKTPGWPRGDPICSAHCRSKGHPQAQPCNRLSTLGWTICQDWMMQTLTQTRGRLRAGSPPSSVIWMLMRRCCTPQRREKQAKQAEDELEDGEHPEAPEEAVLDAPEQRLLDDDSLMLADADNGAAKPTKGDRLKAHDSTAEVAIPGLDSVEPSESAKQFKNDFPSASLRSANRIQHPSAGRQHAAPSARPHTRQTGASAAHTDQAFLPQSASGHLPVDSFGVEALGIGRDSTEQGQRRQSGPKPITLPAPGRPGNAQRMHGSVPKPITLKPPAAARQGGWGFKPHTTEYKR